jgi:hypothetical protein
MRRAWGDESRFVKRHELSSAHLNGFKFVAPSVLQDVSEAEMTQVRREPRRPRPAGNGDTGAKANRQMLGTDHPARKSPT